MEALPYLSVTERVFIFFLVKCVACVLPVTTKEHIIHVSSDSYLHLPPVDFLCHQETQFLFLSLDLGTAYNKCLKLFIVSSEMLLLPAHSKICL
jgi:hypothetical protein